MDFSPPEYICWKERLEAPGVINLTFAAPIVARHTVRHPPRPMLTYPKLGGRKPNLPVRQHKKNTHTHTQTFLPGLKKGDTLATFTCAVTCVCVYVAGTVRKRVKVQLERNFSIASFISMHHENPSRSVSATHTHTHMWPGHSFTITGYQFSMLDPLFDQQTSPGC